MERQRGTVIYKKNKSEPGGQTKDIFVHVLITSLNTSIHSKNPDSISMTPHLYYNT